MKCPECGEECNDEVEGWVCHECGWCELDDDERNDLDTLDEDFDE